MELADCEVVRQSGLDVAIESHDFVPPTGLPAFSVFSFEGGSLDLLGSGTRGVDQSVVRVCINAIDKPGCPVIRFCSNVVILLRVALAIKMKFVRPMEAFREAGLPLIIVEIGSSLTGVECGESDVKFPGKLKQSDMSW